MPPQEIGVKSIWETRQFSRGLGIYLKGLTAATTATNATTAQISALGAALNIYFNQTYANGKLVVAALNAITKAATAAGKAIAQANSRVLGAQARTPRGRAANQTNIVSPRTGQNAQRTTNALRNLSSQANQTGISLDTLSTKSIALGTALGTIIGQALIGLGQSLVAFGRSVLETVTFFEQMDLSIAFYTARSIQATDATVSFSDALAIGEHEAQGLAVWLQRLAVASPFTTRDVATLFRTSQAYGLLRSEAERLTPLLLDFAAAAGLDRDILERLALAIGQVRARGKLTGEEVRQLGNSGIPIRDILVRTLGIANDEFDDLLESGALTSDVVIPAIIKALEVFEGAGERVAFGTIGGIVSAFDELREQGIAKFFTAALSSIKDDFQRLFQVLNRPEVLAFIQVLGQEIGVRLQAAVNSVARSVRGLIAAWNALAPVQQQQIIVFAAVTAGVLAWAAAIAVLTLAVNTLFSPLSLVAITVGFFVSEWTSGFAVLGGLTSRVTGVITRALNGLGTVLGNALNGFLRFLSGANEGFVDFVQAFVGYGENIGQSLARGISSANSAIVASLRGIGSLLTFWLAPGSPPLIYPDIDKDGAATMQEWYNGFAEANPETPLNKAGQVVQRQLTDVVVQQQKDLVDQLNQIHPDLNLTLGDALNQATKDAYLKTEEARRVSTQVHPVEFDLYYSC